MIRRRESPPFHLYTVALACGPLKQPRYINPKIEEELKEFKLEISQKFKASEMNRKFVFPLMSIDEIVDQKIPVEHKRKS